MPRRPLRTGLLVAMAASQACQQPASRVPTGGTLVVYDAGSVAGPLKAALDTFAARDGVTIDHQTASTVETTRKLTALHQIPDLIALSDERPFPTQLVPQYTTWYARFGRDRMTIAYTYESKYSDQLTPRNWYQILARPNVQVGRADPASDPNGAQTLLTLRLAEHYYHQPGLYAAQLRAVPDSNVRPTQADLFDRLQADKLDYVWSLASYAHGDGVKTVALPPEIAGPIIVALSVPTAAPHPDLAARAAAYVLSADGQRIMRAAHLEPLDTVQLVGSGAPTIIWHSIAGSPPVSPTPSSK